VSNERKLMAEEISKLIKNNAKILAMFSGVCPFPIVIAKTLKKNKKTFKIFANELNKKANEFAKENIHKNKCKESIILISGDAKNLPNKTKEKFNIIVMTRPYLKKTYLDTALKLSKKNTIIFYYGFGTKESVLNEIKKDAKEKIGKISIRKAGDIGKGIYRFLAKFKVK